METHPPKLIERIAEAMIPGDCRENVLGDLYERNSYLGAYLRDLLATFPFVLASQIRRTFRLDLFFAEACGLYLAFGGASLVAGPGYLYDHDALFPLAIAIAVMLFVFVLCDAYAGRHRRSGRKDSFHVVLAFSVACVARTVTLFFRPEWTLPAWIMLLGGAASLPMLTMLRDFFRKDRREDKHLQ